MDAAFQVDKFHLNNKTATSVIGDSFSGFNLEDQSKVVCFLLNEELVSPEQVAEMQRVNLILAQKDNEGVLKPLAWGSHKGQHYVIYPDTGRSLKDFEHLKALPPAELLMVMRKLLRALNFADGQGVNSHQSIHPGNIRISLGDGQAKLSLFGYPMTELYPTLASSDDVNGLLDYFPPTEMGGLELPPFQLDLYALGLISLELATATAYCELLETEDRLDAERLRARLSELGKLPLPVQELLYKLLTPMADERYGSFKHALEDVLQLAKEDEKGLTFQTFILDTLINGRFQLGDEIARGRVSRVYSATDTRASEMGVEDEDQTPCVVKLVDLRHHPEMVEAFHTKFKSLTNLHHDHLMRVYDVGVHFENGFIAMESGLQSLEQLLIKRGTLPLNDAGRIIFQLCKALEGMEFNGINYHGAIKPSNVFLTNDLKKIKLADMLLADYFLRHGNLNYIGAEYFNPEMIKEEDCDIRSDIYNLGTLFYELMVGHPPFSFKIEQEIIEDHLHLAAANRVESSLISAEAKDIILRMLEKNPATRYQTITELKDDLTILLGYDKKEQVEIPNLFFDFSELSMVGKNTREKSEETLAVRLPAINNRARGAVALLSGEGPDKGDGAKTATTALKTLREMLFNPGSVSPEFAKQQKTDPEAYVKDLVHRLNLRMYRDAFAAGKTGKMGLSAVFTLIQENTMYIVQVGSTRFALMGQGEILDLSDDKWTVTEELVLGNPEEALSPEVHDRLGHGEVVAAKLLKRRVQDGDQLFLQSNAIYDALSLSEVKELITSSSEPAQAIEMIRSDAIRRRLEGTISCVLLSVGNVVAFAEENISHAKKGMLARNFLAQGDTFLNDGRIDEAIDQYTQALEINPNFSIIHHQLGVAYVRKGLESYGLSCFERALELNSKLAASYVEMAKILERQKRQREVLPLLRQAIAAGCKNANVYAMLGHELLKVRNYDEAILYCTYALELNGAHPTAFRDRMTATKRRNALDTKLLRVFGARQRLADSTVKFEKDEE